MRLLSWLLTPTKWDIFLTLASFLFIWGSFAFLLYRFGWWGDFVWVMVLCNVGYSIGLVVATRDLYRKFWRKDGDPQVPPV